MYANLHNKILQMYPANRFSSFALFNYQEMAFVTWVKQVKTLDKTFLGWEIGFSTKKQEFVST